MLPTARRVLLPFLLVVSVATAELVWWITFQVRSASQYASVRRELVLLQSQDRTSAPTIEILKEIDHEATRRVRMFVMEGVFFLFLLLLGVWLILRVMRREVALAQRQANFLAAVTHELQSPLASIRLTADTLEMRYPDEKIKRYSHRLLGDVERLQTLVTHVLASAAVDHKISRQKLGERILFDAAVKQCIDGWLKHHPGCVNRVTVEYHAGNGCVMLPHEYISMIVGNVLDNARKYGGTSGSIVWTTKVEGHRVMFSCCDQGMGLLPEDCERIFERFYRVGDERVRETQGSGLGLFLVRAMLRDGGGDVTAHSAGLGQGTCIQGWLPRVVEGRS